MTVTNITISNLPARIEKARKQYEKCDKPDNHPDKMFKAACLAKLEAIQEGKDLTPFNEAYEEAKMAKKALAESEANK